ncbi:MAG: hypothetical protein V2I43_14300 [Parvularcula sp.]|jgi:flagellar basal body-associated protein FliL|nr:hypothetical protein [Parvularcula sp.]
MTDPDAEQPEPKAKSKRGFVVIAAGAVVLLSAAGGWFAATTANGAETAKKETQASHAPEATKEGKEAKLEPILLDPLVLTLPQDRSRSCGGRVRIVAALMSKTYQGELRVPLTGALLEAAYKVDCSAMGSSEALPRMRQALTEAAREILKDPDAEVLITEFVLL